MTDTLSDLPLAVLTPTPWVNHGACHGTDPGLFFPTRGEDVTNAKAVCGTCPVRSDCLKHALDTHERFGVWGGCTEDERRAIRRQLRTGDDIAVVVAERTRSAPLPEPPRKAKPIKHGTNSGYVTHHRRGEPPCPDCIDAHRQYERRLYRLRKQAAA